jgi:hypothetical protein
MSEARGEARAATQQAYGRYCSNCYANSREPMPYYEFSDLFQRGFTVKQILKGENYGYFSRWNEKDDRIR